MESEDYDLLEEEEETIVEKLNILWKDVPQKEAMKPLVFGENVKARMVTLYNMRQNSKSCEEFKKLEELTDHFMCNAAAQGELVIEARFLVEQAKNAYYRKDMPKTIELLNKVIEKSLDLRPHETYHLQLLSRFLMISSYSHLHEFGTAYGILQQLQHKVEHSENYVDKWKLYYNTGTHYVSYLKAVDEPLPALRSEAKQWFAKCRDAIPIAIESGTLFGIQETIYPLVMMAKILLDIPETKSGQQRYVVTLEDLEEVDDIITNIKAAIPVHSMGVRLKARLAITEGGLHFRLAQRTIKIASNARKTKRYDNDKYDKHLRYAYRKVSQALISLDFAKLMCLSTPYEELQFAQDFTDYIKKYTHMKIHSELSALQSDGTSSTSSEELSSILSESDKDTKEINSFSSSNTESSECAVSESLNNLFLAGATHKHFLYDPVPWDVQEHGMRGLNEVEQLVVNVIPQDNQIMSFQHSVHQELVLYPRILMARLGTDFPDTVWGMKRFAVTVENIEETKQNLKFIKESIHPHCASDMFKVYYLLCEGGLSYREGQISHNMKYIKKTKLCLADAIFRIEHALCSLVNDVNNVKCALDSLLKVLIEEQKRLFNC